MHSDYLIYIILTGALGLLGMFVSNRLRSKFEYYGQMAIPNGMTGADIAKKMLQQNGIFDVRVTQVDGVLTDHYNPTDKTVNLSSDVYHGRSVSAAAVAAHECGHAVQHAQAYSMLTLRSKLVPAVQIASTAQQFIMMGMMFAGIMMKSPIFLLLAVIVFGVTALFSLVTLPVEFDASRRALAWLKSSNTSLGTEYDGAKDALTWAAMTYVVAALSAVSALLFFLLRFLNSRE